MKSFLVIPAYNEAPRIGSVIARAKNLVDWVIVVDDGSSDETAAVAEVFGGKVMVVRHFINLGKGAALKTGCRAAVQLGADVLVTIDADGQHPPELIPEVLDYLRKNNLDFVFTARQGGDKMPMLRYLGNRAVNGAVRNLFGLKANDVWCGFRAFRSDCLEKIMWRQSDYSGEIEMALRVAIADLNYGEYFVPTVYHDKLKGVTFINGLKLLMEIFLWRIKLWLF